MVFFQGISSGFDLVFGITKILIYSQHIKVLVLLEDIN